MASQQGVAEMVEKNLLFFLFIPFTRFVGAMADLSIEEVVARINSGATELDLHVIQQNIGLI